MTATIRDRRHTAQKEAVRSALSAAGGFVSAGELHLRMSSQGHGIGLATVYRQLNALAENGHADTLLVPGGQLFRACEPGAHHHHLVCESCGTAVEIDPPDEDWIAASADRNGFTVTRHLVEVFGQCAECSEG